MSLNFGLPVCLSGINVSTKMLPVGQTDSYCVQARESSRAAEQNAWKEASASGVTLSGSPPPQEVSKETLKREPINTVTVQSVRNGSSVVCMQIQRKRRLAVIKEMRELDQLRVTLKHQKVYQENLESYLRMQAIYSRQQQFQYDAQDIIRCFLNRQDLCTKDLHSTAAKAA